MTGRDSTVESALITNTNGPCCPACTAWVGTTTARAVVSVSATSTYWPGHSALSLLAKVAFSWMVPVVGSTVLFMNVTAPAAAGCFASGIASTFRVPSARYFLMAVRCCWGTANDT